MDPASSQHSSSKFQVHAPSQNWEQVTLAWLPGGFVWAWFKPANAPQDVIVRIPDELWSLMGNNGLTMRQLLSALEVRADEVQLWSIQGMTLDPQGGMNPLLDHPLPAPVAWADSTISIRCHLPGVVPTMMPPAPGLPAAGAVPWPNPGGGSSLPVGADSEKLLAAMDSDWHAILGLETQLGMVRKQLNTIQGRLQSMNRDFTTDERQAADSNDVKNWQDARRFLRDASGNVSRFIREHDIGITSVAGQRNRFEEIYKNHVATRQPFAGMESVQHEFETYRKIVQSLLTKMQTALSNAGSNGEQRAQQVLSRVAAKMRKSRNRG